MSSPGTTGAAAAGSTSTAGNAGTAGSAVAVGASGSGGMSGGAGTSGSVGMSGSAGASGGVGMSGSAGASGSAAGSGSLGAGWLYTTGSKINVSDGKGGGTQWMGRGVNVSDIYLCGYNNTLWMTNADQVMEDVISTLYSTWKPNFVRISLSMNSFPTVTSWLTNPSQYKTPMTNVINSIGTHAGLYVLVTLRSDASMIDEDTGSDDPEATGVPSNSSDTPSASTDPTGTDATYVGIVDSFANAPYVLFGLTNEPGGSNTLTDDQLCARLNHAVGTIRAEEDKLGVPHHIVSVQGNGWSSDISLYAKTPMPITYDNVVYEIHGYPPATASYTYSNIPVIIGEYGSLPDSDAFFADVEAKQIPNLAWDYDPYSGCGPELLTPKQSPTNIVPTAWGRTVQAYLLKHAQQGGAWFGIGSISSSSRMT
ncbi:MAG TPA: cellulase family glycosylhydrolase [Polyangiaceae bacterium]|nr:cellulase family glycosylhydrolase [Polyangiaceae bacterium]